jgi:hypothetical protein
MTSSVVPLIATLAARKPKALFSLVVKVRFGAEAARSVAIPEYVPPRRPRMA